MVRAELTNTCTAGIDINHSTTVVYVHLAIYVLELNVSVATLLLRKTPEFTLKKKQKIIKNPRHKTKKCLKKAKTKLEMYATGTCT